MRRHELMAKPIKRQLPVDSGVRPEYEHPILVVIILKTKSGYIRPVDNPSDHDHWRCASTTHATGDKATMAQAAARSTHNGEYSQLSKRANVELRIRLKNPTSRKSPIARRASSTASNSVPQRYNQSGAAEPSRPKRPRISRAQPPSANATARVPVFDGTNAGRSPMCGSVAVMLPGEQATANIT